jgi:hypothetical protein
VDGKLAAISRGLPSAFSWTPPGAEAALPTDHLSLNRYGALPPTKAPFQAGPSSWRNGDAGPARRSRMLRVTACPAAESRGSAGAGAERSAASEGH